jgi:radical SAM protein with 4Fe4S-binding SPASM domain
MLENSESYSEPLLQRSPSISWRELPRGSYVHDHASGQSYFLDALGAEVLRRFDHPLRRTDVVEALARPRWASRVIDALSDSGILREAGERPRSRRVTDVWTGQPDQLPLPSDAFPADLVEHLCRGSQIPLTAGIEWTNGAVIAPAVELPTDVWIDAFDQLAALGTVKLIVAGAEPLLRSDALFLLRCARERGFAVSLFTDAGQISDDFAAALADLYLDAIWISLYSASPRAHDAVTWVPGSHRRALAAIRALLDRDQPVRVAGLPRNATLLEATRLIEMSASLQVPMVLDPLLSLEMDDSVEMDDGSPGCRTAVSLADAAEEPVPVAARQPSLFVMSDGTVRRCREHPVKAGSILESPLADLWRDTPGMHDAGPLRRQPQCDDCTARTTCFADLASSDDEPFGELPEVPRVQPELR